MDDCHQDVNQEQERPPSSLAGINLHADETTKEILDKIGAHISDPNLKIVVSGKTGIGKSSLVHSLFLPEGDQFEFPPRTDRVNVRETQISSPSGQPITVKATDTPGTEALVGIGNRSNHAAYLKEVSPAFREADIQLFCVRMDDDVREEEVKIIRFFRKNFGEILWAKVIFVLTFANRVVIDEPDEEKERKFNERFEEMKAALLVAMTEAGIPENVARATPVCVAGHPDPAKKRLPNCEDWTCTFLVDCLKSGIAENLKFTLIKATWARWLTNPVRVSFGAAGATGITTGLGIMIVGGILSGALVTLPLGVPLLMIGSSITLYSGSATAYQAAQAVKRRKKELETQEKIKNLQEEHNTEN